MFWQEWECIECGRWNCFLRNKCKECSAFQQTCIVCNKPSTYDNKISYGPNILLHYDCEKKWANGEKF